MSCHNTFGLKSDGTVVGTGHGRFRELEIEDWENIVDISFARNNAIGVKKDGSVVVSGTLNKQIGMAKDWKLW